MKKKIIAVMFFAMVAVSLSGCSEASRVSSNLSKEADNFNDVRQITVINCLKGETLFQMTGKMSITAGDVSKYKYTLNFNPKMWLPVEIDTID